MTAIERTDMLRFPRTRKTRAQKIEDCGSTKELNSFLDNMEARGEVQTSDDREAAARCRVVLAKRGL